MEAETRVEPIGGVNLQLEEKVRLAASTLTPTYTLPLFKPFDIFVCQLDTFYCVYTHDISPEIRLNLAYPDTRTQSVHPTRPWASTISQPFGFDRLLSTREQMENLINFQNGSMS